MPTKREKRKLWEAACAAETQRPYVFLRNSLMLWGSLALQRRKDLLSSTNGPTRVGAALGFSAPERTTQLVGQGMRKRGKNAARQLLEARSSIRGNVA